MPNVVLDSSSLVGAFLKEGSVPEKALTLAQAKATIVLSPAVEAEIREVVGRPKFRPYVTPDREERFLAFVVAKAVLFEPTIPVTDCRDPKDNKYLELALAAGAEVIVSSDQDLLVLHPWRGIDVITPAEFVARFT